jgi:hypothetical protein
MNKFILISKRETKKRYLRLKRGGGRHTEFSNSLALAARLAVQLLMLRVHVDIIEVFGHATRSADKI